MTPYVSEFIEFLSGSLCAPADGSEIIADGKVRRFTIAGDKPKSRNGRYALWDEGDFASGWVINSRIGEMHKWNTRVRKKLTDAERREYARKVEANRLARDEAQAKTHAAVALKAEKNWKNAAKGKHPYLDRKQIAGTGSRVMGKLLVIPAYKAGKMVSLQYIAEDGAKRFLTGGEIQGAYGSIGKDVSTIYICEGYATAHSVHDASGKASIWAFNAGNLSAVAKTIREKYPDSQIVMVADNDQWTVRQDGAAWNPGIEKATAAAKEVGALIIFPDFAVDHAKKYTDCNDYCCEFGKGALKSLLQCATAVVADGAVEGRGNLSRVVAKESEAPPPFEYNSETPNDTHDWRGDLICDGKGNVIKNSLKNTIVFLQNHSRYEGVFRYNEFSHQIIVARCPEWTEENYYRVHPLNDIDITETAAAMESVGMSPDRARVHHAIEVAAGRNSFHPARDYFQSLQWDGEHRLENWLVYYFGAEDDDLNYLAFIGKKWLVAAVKRAFHPGCKFDHVLVMEGTQGKGKSAALKLLATFGDDIEEAYFTDSVTIADLADKDTIQKIQGSIIVELAELAGFGKKDDEEIKRWVTLQHDTVRLPYTRTVTRFPRQFVLSATTNNHDYLKDPTGNRRYWPVKSSSIDFDALARDRKQLWAEAYHHYKEGLYIGPTDEEMQLATAAQEKRRAVDVWEGDILKAYSDLADFSKIVKVEDILRKIGLSIRDMDFKSQRRVISVLQQNGYTSTIIRDGDKTQRGWVRQIDD
jgi:putative DNA primase/helicase